MDIYVLIVLIVINTLLIYDYVGCGNKHFNKLKTNFNGGFSIRKIKSMQYIIKTIPLLKTKKK